MKTLLFLDFDGVLHPLWESAPFNDWQLEVTFGPKAYAGPFFLHAAALAEAVSPFLENLDIVVSSTWGKQRPLHELKQLLPVLVEDRLVDAVPHHLPSIKEAKSRWEEISWYLQNIRPHQGDRWLALDDDDMDWPDAMRSHLVHCMRDLGDAHTHHKLEAVLIQRCGAWS